MALLSSPSAISLCGSMRFVDAMEALAAELCAQGHTVHTPEREEDGVDWDRLSPEAAVARKAGFLNGHFSKIRQSDLVLIANYEKNGIPGYIGANTLMEAACGHALGKPVYLLFPPGAQSCHLEALAVCTAVLDGKVSSLDPRG